MASVSQGRLGTADNFRLYGTSHGLPVPHRLVEPVVMFLDFVLILLVSFAVIAVYYTFESQDPDHLEKLVGLGVVSAILFCVAQKAREGYRPSRLIGRTDVGGTLFTWLGVFLFMFTLAFILRIGHLFPRSAVFALAASGSIVVVLARLIGTVAIAKAIRLNKFTYRKIAVLGDETGVMQNKPRKMAGFGYDVKMAMALPSRFEDNGQNSHRIRDVIRHFVSKVLAQPVDEVIVAVSWSDTDTLAIIREEMQLLPVPVSLVADDHIGTLLDSNLFHIGPCMAVELQRAPLSIRERAIKRAGDFVLASLAMFCLLPMFVIVGAAIKLTSSGPVFFRQTRNGFGGRQFKIYKFRTMKVMEDGAQVRQARKNDSRITTVGKWLRRTSIDELPQLLNVIVGDMSLVGPRPHAVAHNEEYNKLIARYAFRHHMKPGITGWAQVKGFRGETLKLEAMEKRVKYDLWYINNWSIMLDCQILVRTVFEVLRGQNAY